MTFPFAFLSSVCYFYAVPRLFVAVPFPGGLWERFAEVRAAFAGQALALKWVPAENLHLTLKFLGDLPDDRLSAAREAMRRAASGAAPFDVEWLGLGAFPSARRPDVVWAGMGAGRTSLEGLAARVETAFVEAGFAPEVRSFHAHLTLARIKRDRRPARPLEFAAWETATFGADPVREVVLMRSDLKPTGPVYHAVDVVPLEDRKDQR